MALTFLRRLMPRPSINHRGRNIPPWSSRSATQHYAMLARNLLYTGLTRGKRLVVLVGQRRALAIAVRNAAHRQRWSRLREWLRLVPPQT
jgi:hypothetical protein